MIAAHFLNAIQIAPQQISKLPTVVCVSGALYIAGSFGKATLSPLDVNALFILKTGMLTVFVQSSDGPGHLEGCGHSTDDDNCCMQMLGNEMILHAGFVGQ